MINRKNAGRKSLSHATRTIFPPIRKSLQNNLINRKGAGMSHLARTRDGDVAVYRTRCAVSALPYSCDVVHSNKKPNGILSVKEGRHSGRIRIKYISARIWPAQPGLVPRYLSLARIYTLLNTPFKRFTTSLYY